MKAIVSLLVLMISMFSAYANVSTTSLNQPNEDFIMSQDEILSVLNDYDKRGIQVLNFTCLASDNVEANCAFHTKWSSVLCNKGESVVQANITFLANTFEVELIEKSSVCHEAKFRYIK